VQSYVKYLNDMQHLFIADVLLWKFINGYTGRTFVCTQQSNNGHHGAEYPIELNTFHMIELLQKSAVEYLTSYRQTEAREFGSVATIVTTDFEALYAYKLGDYQRCLQLSTQNVRTLLYAVRVTHIWTLPEFIQLMDDDIVSLTAMTLIVDPDYRGNSLNNVCISQLTLSLYLMTQCQLKLRHSVMSVAQTLDYIKVAHRRYPVEATLDRLVLKMTGRKALMYIRTMMNKL